MQGIHFDWDYSVDYTPEQQVAYEQLVLNNYEVDPSYFEEKYNMPVGDAQAARFPFLAPHPPTVAVKSPRAIKHPSQAKRATGTK